MMHSWSNSASNKPTSNLSMAIKCAAVMLLLIVQAFIVAGLMHAEPRSVMVFCLSLGLAVALLCCAALMWGGRITEMVVVMLAAGGFGMAFGMMFEQPGHGSHAMMSHASHSMGWSYAGMFIAGNVAMWMCDSVARGRWQLSCFDLYIYAICNIGMFTGMVLGEYVLIHVVHGSYIEGMVGLMYIAMLIGMVIGMITALWLSMRVVVRYFPHFQKRLSL